MFYREGFEALDELSQGDLLYPVPFTSFDLNAAEVLDDADQARIWTLDQRLVPSDIKSGRLTVDFIMDWGLVLNQGCDLAKHSQQPIAVARITPCEKLFPGWNFRQLKEKKFSNSGQAPQFFLLPENVDVALPLSAAMLLHVQTYPRENVDTLLKVRKLSLSANATRIMQDKVAYMYQRFAVPDGFYG